MMRNRENVILVSLSTVLAFFCLTEVAQAQTGSCSPASVDQITFWGTQNVIMRETSVLRSVKGRVIRASDSISGALVEIYDNADTLLLGPIERQEAKSKQNRLAACITGNDGKFSFPKLSAGTYELRVSKASDWDAISYHLVVEPSKKNAVNKFIVVRMRHGI